MGKNYLSLNYLPNPTLFLFLCQVRPAPSPGGTATVAGSMPWKTTAMDMRPAEEAAPWVLQPPALGDVNSKIFYFHPEPWGNDPIWLAQFFSNGLVKNHQLVQPSPEVKHSHRPQFDPNIQCSLLFGRRWCLHGWHVHLLLLGHFSPVDWSKKPTKNVSWCILCRKKLDRMI